MKGGTAHALSNYEIRREGWKALTERLGVSGAIRFLMQYDPGYGDYLIERERLFAGLTLEAAIQTLRAGEQGGRAGEQAPP